MLILFRTGKSTVSKLIQQSDIPLIDLDILARQAVQAGSPALAQIARVFPPSVINASDGSLNREALGDIIFNDPDKRKVLNGIVHPAVRRLMVRELVKHWLHGSKICVVDAPLLIEAGLWKWCGKIIIVYWYGFPALLLVHRQVLMLEWNVQLGTATSAKINVPKRSIARRCRIKNISATSTQHEATLRRLRARQ